MKKVDLLADLTSLILTALTADVNCIAHDMFILRDIETRQRSWP